MDVALFGCFSKDACRLRKLIVRFYGVHQSINDARHQTYCSKAKKNFACRL